MKSNKTDVMIYFKPDGQPATGLAQGIKDNKGVIYAGNNPYVKNIINVEYDPSQISGLQILNSVKERGCPAWMVGM